MDMNIPGIWGAVESEFFITETMLPAPNEIIDGIYSDKAHRDMMEEDHPLKGRMNTPGCYLYYCYYDWGEGVKPVYIYAGKTVQLGRRLWEHWTGNEGKVEAFFVENVDSGKLDLEVVLETGSVSVVQPEPIVRVALWFIDNERDRTMLEHGIIYSYRPWMNFG